MRFMVMHKVDAKMEAGTPPDQSIIQGMGKLVQDSLKSGVFENGAGLHRSATRVRLVFKNGQRTVTEGPYSGHNELVFACFMLKTVSREQAVEQAGQFAKILGDVEIEVGPVVEPWDLGLIPKPAELSAARFLLLVKGDARTEQGPLAAATLSALTQLEKQLNDEGALLAAEVLAPSSRGLRLASQSQAKRAWVDGPFAESKELIAGFSILSLPTREAALAWAAQYAAILGENEVDIREIAEKVG
ncbi:MAG TPA: YciI family protein [Polyangiaceae bacterium]|jgi:hypothetical protein|nr:YciI family protein [Polyangiaceae bacterium]